MNTGKPEQRRPSQRPRWVARWAGIAISLAALIWVLHTVDLGQVGRALQAASLVWLAPVAVLLPAGFMLRAARWGTLFGRAGKPRWRNLFLATTIGYLGNNILPARAGEFIRAYVLGQRERMAKSAVLATVIVERVVDLLVVLFLLAVTLLVYPLPDWLERAGAVAGVVSVAALAFVVCLGLWGYRLVGWILRWLRFLPGSWLSKLEAVGSGFLAGVSGSGSWQQMVSFLAYTGVIWFLEVLIVWLVAQALSLPISMGGCLCVMLAVGLGTMIPSSPGYVGTYEFFAAGALAVLGITGGEALAFVFVLHGITFAGSSILGAVCLALTGGGLARMSVESQRQQEIVVGVTAGGQWDQTHQARPSGRD